MVSALEIKLYSNKIASADWANFFKTLFKRRISSFDIVDLSTLLPIKSIKLIIKKDANTVRLYLRDKQAEKEDLSALIFPLKLSSPTQIQLSRGFPFGLYFLNNAGLFPFMVKESAREISFRIFPFLGHYFALGNVTRENGSRRFIFHFNPTDFLEIDLENNPSFFMELIEKPLLKSVYMDSSEPIFISKEVKIGINNFDVFKHSLVLGMSGCGKSVLIRILTKAIKRKYGPQVKMVLIDPHGEFSKSMAGEANVIDFKKTYIEPLEIGREQSPMTTQLIEELIMSIIGEKNKYADRVLFYSIHLLSSIGALKLQNISKLLTDTAVRMEYLSKTDNAEIKRFFSTEFDDIYIHHFNDAVLPVLNFVGEYELYMGKHAKAVPLFEAIQQSEVLVISFDPHFFGRKMIKFLAGAVIQQMYILAITQKFKQPTVFIIDEFQLVENSVVPKIHTETRKFNLHLYLSLQYLTQLQKETIDSILTNVYNYIIFKCNREDATTISSNMDIKVEEFFKKNLQPSELEERKRDLFVELMNRECIVRLFDGEKQLMPLKVSVADFATWERVQIPRSRADLASLSPPAPVITQRAVPSANGFAGFKKDESDLLGRKEEEPPGRLAEETEGQPESAEQFGEFAEEEPAEQEEIEPLSLKPRPKVPKRPGAGRSKRKK